MFVVDVIRWAIDKLWNNFVFYSRKVVVGQNVKIRGRINVCGEGEIFLADDITINSNIRYNAIGGQSGCTFNVRSGAQIIIGRGTGISNTTFCSWQKIELGEDVYIGGDCRIYDTDFHSLRKDNRVRLPDVHVKSKSVHIKDGAWLGASVIVLKGVTIGENSVVGAGSVVTKDIPPNQIWAGNPARYIKDIPTSE
ncbi:acyltransferase [Selenomonas ruminantium]|uniref:Acetyltransferase (Isoleucine patch superfamily) n=1 Tax=Selenomonas ruminantium TaxID=971 RepID=A0A1H0M6Y1_SELRU|nr:acyltransferase [Selenomonas ruminantium]SDO76183.1 Acetyltransferase (isoleucine patch superfamily) [Selenomonas ruminantium]